MKLLLACVLALAAPAAARAESVIYVLDSEHSFVHFEVLHFGTSTVRGRFGPLNGLVELDREAGRGSVFLRIPMASLDTGIHAFNARLRQPDLLASEVYPTAEFASANFVFDGRTLTAVNGELTLRGTRQGVELRALRFGCHTHPVLHREVCGGDFEGQLKRGDFGASFGMPFVENRVRLRVQVEGIRQ